jgi:hypothetical protein
MDELRKILRSVIKVPALAQMPRLAGAEFRPLYGLRQSSVLKSGDGQENELEISKPSSMYRIPHDQVSATTGRDPKLISASLRTWLEKLFIETKSSWALDAHRRVSCPAYYHVLYFRDGWGERLVKQTKALTH